jgi:hypothetical protein
VKEKEESQLEENCARPCTGYHDMLPRMGHEPAGWFNPRLGCMGPSRQELIRFQCKSLKGFPCHLIIPPSQLHSLGLSCACSLMERSYYTLNLGNIEVSNYISSF